MKRELPFFLLVTLPMVAAVVAAIHAHFIDHRTIDAFVNLAAVGTLTLVQIAATLHTKVQP